MWEYVCVLAHVMQRISCKVDKIKAFTMVHTQQLQHNKRSVQLYAVIMM